MDDATEDVEPPMGPLAPVRVGLLEADERPSPPAPHRPDPGRYASVTTAAPDIRIDGPTAPDALQRVRHTAGVAHATLVHVGRVQVGSGDDTLVVAAVDPVEYRRMTPQVTADAIGVWEALDEGAVIVTHEHAQRLALELGGDVWLGGEHGPTLRVGAVATNGAPPLAGAIVDRATGARLGLDAVPPTILVRTGDAAPSEVARRLEAVAADAITVVPDPRSPHPVTPNPPEGATVWDVLAMCESSGDWRANTGNGFYGGLQFLPESWAMVGGSGLPHAASREEQIHRAELLLDRQGWKAWPVCSVQVGLREPQEE